MIGKLSQRVAFKNILLRYVSRFKNSKINFVGLTREIFWGEYFSLAGLMNELSTRQIRNVKERFFEEFLSILSTARKEIEMETNLVVVTVPRNMSPGTRERLNFDGYGDEDTYYFVFNISELIENNASRILDYEHSRRGNLGEGHSKMVLRIEAKEKANGLKGRDNFVKQIKAEKRGCEKQLEAIKYKLLQMKNRG
jgi:hypothetical protein